MKPDSSWPRLFVLALLLMTLAGCAARLEIGAPPQFDRLAGLTPHISTRSDVLLAMGEPRGHGAARLNPALARQQVWMYEHSISEGKNIRLTMLLVFFSGEHYEGYMWFADNLNLQSYPNRGGEK